MDDAVWADIIDDPGGIITGWQELRDPITPEPITMVVLALGLLPVLMLRRQRKMIG